MAMSQQEADKAAVLLENPGWLILHSSVLDEDVLWVRDADVDVPLRHSVHIRYTHDELRLLVEQKPDADALRMIHKVKTTFEGTVIPLDAPLPKFDPGQIVPRKPQPVLPPTSKPEPVPEPQLTLV